jgi:hypothetical protein
MSTGRVATLLAERRVDHLLPWMNHGVECDGSKFHSPRPLLVRPYDLTRLVEQVQVGGAGVAPGEHIDPEALIHLCAVCFDNLTVFLSILLAYDGQTPEAVRRDFANLIRDLGDAAWSHHLKRSRSAPV